MGEQTVGETAGGSADVDGIFAGDFDGELAQRLFQLDAAAADVGRRGFYADRRCAVDQIARFGDRLLVDQNFAGQNPPPPFFPARHQLALDQEQV